MVEAPWTVNQVAKLNEWQACRHVHPFTCGSGNRSDPAHMAAATERGDHDYGVLIATEAGWTCPACNYTQGWAHDFMFRGAPPHPLAHLRSAEGVAAQVDGASSREEQ